MGTDLGGQNHNADIAKLLSAEQAILDGPPALNTSDRIPFLFVCSLYEDQRPLKGVAGALDWRLRGFLSRFLMNGSIKGERGEVVYVPVQHHGSTRHLLLLGLGHADSAIQHGDAENLRSEVTRRIAKAVSDLKVKHVVISQSSFRF